MILLGAAYSAVKRALAADQGRGPRSPLPLWRLVIDEIVLMGKRIGRWKIVTVTGVVFASVLLVETLLTPVTPGPTAEQPWRVLVAVLVAVVALTVWAVVHAHRHTVLVDLRDRPGRRPARTAVERDSDERVRPGR